MSTLIKLDNYDERESFTFCLRSVTCLQLSHPSQIINHATHISQSVQGVKRFQVAEGRDSHKFIDQN